MHPTRPSHNPSTVHSQDRTLMAQNDVRNAHGQVGARQARQPGITSTTLASETVNQQKSKPPAQHPAHHAWYHYIWPF
jgi:hypothetical protein